jgi:hypothetical protein
MSDDRERAVAMEAVVRAAYEEHPSASPAWLATATMHAIDFPRALHPVGYLGAHQMAEQIAHMIRSGKDPGQIVRALETVEADPPLELTGDVETLRAQAAALARHADALKAERANKYPNSDMAERDPE